MHALAFRDSRNPMALLGAFSDVAERHESVFDLGFFRLADAVPLSAPISPLQTFLVR